MAQYVCTQFHTSTSTDVGGCAEWVEIQAVTELAAPLPTEIYADYLTADDKAEAFITGVLPVFMFAGVALTARVVIELVRQARG